MISNKLQILTPSKYKNNISFILSAVSSSSFDELTNQLKDKKNYEVISSFQDDPFVGHLSTPITTSFLTKSYLSLLPAYKTGLSPLLRGLNIGYTHGYFLLGPFVKLGPLRDSQVANFVGFLSTISLIIILTACLIIYGYVTFSEKNDSKTLNNFLTPKGWKEFTSGFIVGGFGGTSVAYLVLKLINIY